MRTIQLIIFLLATSIIGMSQDAPIKFKEIPIEQMKMTVFNGDTSASAIILCDYGQRYFDLNPNGKNLFLFNDRHVRIKILKPEGLKYALVRVPYKDMTCEDFPEENSIVIKGMTYNIDNKGVIKATKLKQNRIKRIDSIGCYKIAEFELPDVKPGSIIEYKISIPTLDLISPESWKFQNEIPTLYSEFRMKIPNAYSYLISPQNIQDFNISEEKFFNQALIFAPRYYNNFNSVSSPFVLNGKQIRLVKTGIQKFEFQNFTNRQEDLLQSLKIHLVRATRENKDYIWESLTRALAITTTEDYDVYDPKQRKQIMYPAPFVYYNLPNWEKFNQKLLKSERFGLALMKHWNYEQILQEIIKDKENPEQKMIAIYDFMRKNMKWNGEYSIFVDPVFNNAISKLYTRITKKLGNERSLRKPFEEGLGSSSEINLTLIYLLNNAGIETYPVIISTTDHGRIDTVIPDPKQFNHVMALAKINGNPYFLDAIDSLRPYNMLDKKDNTSQGFVVRGIDFGWINVKSNEPNILSSIEQIDLDKDLNYKLNHKISENGYYALDHRNEIKANGIEAFIKKESEKYFANSQSSKFDVQNAGSDSTPLIIELSKSGKSTVPGQISFVPNFKPVYSEKDFADIFRKYLINLPYTFTNSYLMEINVPEGFTAILPENSSFESYGGNASYNYEITKQGDKITVKIMVTMKTIEFPAHEYDNLKQLFTELNEKIEEEIIIKKLDIGNL